MSCRQEAEDDDYSAIHLFEQEEQELLEILLLPAHHTTQRRKQSLQLRQYGSGDDRWGIHSSVWDGGIALLHYATTRWEPVATLLVKRDNDDDGDDDNDDDSAKQHLQPAAFVIDLGSGTGITGLGIAALTKGQCKVALTDLLEASLLLQENVELNCSHWSDGDGTSTPPTVQELTWGNKPCAEWLPEFMEELQQSTTEPSTRRRRRRRVLITGADIVYRPSLFEPLLITLGDLHRQLLDLKGVDQVDIWFSCQAIRSHLNDFWEAAAQHGFETKVLAAVRLNESNKTDLTLASTCMEPTAAFDPKQLPRHATANRCDGVNWIVALTKVAS